MWSIYTEEGRGQSIAERQGEGGPPRALPVLQPQVPPEGKGSPWLLPLHTASQPCLKPRERAHPGPSRLSLFHSALPYWRSAEYLCSLPSSEPNQDSLEFHPSSGTVGKYRASVPSLSKEMVSPAHRAGRAGED